MATVAAPALDDGWARARAAALDRDGHRCRRCGASVASELDVHHRMPRQLGVDHSPANLVTLCDGCHAGLHLNFQVGLAGRTIQRWAVRLARWLDVQQALPPGDLDLGPALRMLGKDRLRKGQLAVILAILAGKDVLAVRPTGSGKSLCFQVPILLRDGTALVIEPLKALMKDQVRGLHDAQVPATFISSDVPRGERAERLRMLAGGVWKFVYLAPERFDAGAIVDPAERDKLLQLRPSCLVIDEAHTVPQYGDGFRPAYRQLGEIRRELGNPQVVAFTATAGAETQGRILRALRMDGATVIVEDPDRPNIALVRLPMAPADRRRETVVAHQLRRLQGGKAIIFVPTRKVGLEVQARLAARGQRLEFYHGQAEPGWRDQIENRFAGRLRPELNAVIATSAFGMGLDVPNVRLVVNWQHPFSVEDYLQGFGRAGRDGKPATAILFVGPDDQSLLRFMTERELAPERRGERLRGIEVMNQIATAQRSCFRQRLTDHLSGGATGKQPISVRILEWAFAERARATRAEACCDACSPKLARQILDCT